MGIERSIVSGLGPINKPMLPTAVVPLGGSGTSNNSAILNNTVGSAAAVKVIAAHPSPQHRHRRLKIVAPAAGTNLAWALTNAGDPQPALTALGAGGANDGSLIEGGGGATEWMSIPDNLDLWLVASAAATPYQITMVEV